MSLIRERRISDDDRVLRAGLAWIETAPKRLAQLRRLMAEGVTIDRAWREVNDVRNRPRARHRRRTAPPTTRAFYAMSKLMMSDEEYLAPTKPSRFLVDVPDKFAVARWSRDADVATISRCILATLKYEPHAADVTELRRALEGVIGAIVEQSSQPKIVE
jgi:hypothetical protein